MEHKPLFLLLIFSFVQSRTSQQGGTKQLQRLRDQNCWKVRASMADFAADSAADFLADFLVDFVADFLAEFSADFPVDFFGGFCREFLRKRLPATGVICNGPFGPIVSKKFRNEFPGPLGFGGPKSPKRNRKREHRRKRVDFDSFSTPFETFGTPAGNSFRTLLVDVRKGYALPQLPTTPPIGWKHENVRNGAAECQNGQCQFGSRQKKP